MNLFLSSAVLLLSFTASAETIESTEFKYYEISPGSPYQIKPELMRHSPIRAGSGSFNGHTDWYINWRFRSSREANGCQLIDSQTKVHVVHILPKLSAQVTEQQTIDVFNKFNKALTQHEINHGKNGLSAAREMDKTFNELAPQQNCRNLARLIDRIGNDVVRKYAEKDNEYDRLTNNGESEGAVIY